MKKHSSEKLLRILFCAVLTAALGVGLAACRKLPEIETSEEISSVITSEIPKTEKNNAFANRAVGTYSCEDEQGNTVVLTVCNVYGNLYAEKVYYANDDGLKSAFAYEAVELIPASASDFEDKTKTECEIGVMIFSNIANAGQYSEAPRKAKLLLGEGDLIIEYEEEENGSEKYVRCEDAENVFAYEAEAFESADFVTPDSAMEGLWRQTNTDNPLYLEIKSTDNDVDMVQIYQKERGTEVYFGRGFLKEDSDGKVQISYKTIHSYTQPNHWSFRFVPASNGEITIRTEADSYNNPLGEEQTAGFERIEGMDVPMVSLFEVDDKNAYQANLTYKTSDGKDRSVLPQFLACADVENNGGFFVRVGKLVFYRYYDSKNLPEMTGFLGAFTDDFTLQDSSYICYYDPETRETGVAFKDSGRGPLYYLNGWFVTCIYEPDETSSINSVVKCWPDGSGLKGIAADGFYNYVMAVSDDGTLLAYRSMHTDSIVSTRGNTDAMYQSIQDEEYVETACYVGHDLFSIVYTGENHLEFYLLHEDDRELYKIGEYDAKEEYQYGYPYVYQTYRDEETGHILTGLTWLDGNGIVVGFTVLEMEDTANGKAEILYNGYPEECKNGGFPSFYFNYENDLLIDAKGEGDVFLSNLSYGDLIYQDSPYSAVLVASEYIPVNPYETDPDKEAVCLEDAEIVDGNVFVIKSHAVLNTERGYTTRPQYDLRGFDFSVIPLNTASGLGDEYEEILLLPELK